MEIIVIGDLTTGKRIRLARIARGLRQVDLAALAQVPLMAVSDAENDLPMKRWKLMRILQALDLSWEDTRGSS